MSGVSDTSYAILSAFCSAAQLAAKNVPPLLKTIRSTIEKNITPEDKALLKKGASDLNDSATRIRSATTAVINDPIMKQLWDNATDIAKAGTQIRHDPLNGGVNLLWSLGNLTRTLFNAGVAQLDVNDKESIAAKAQVVLQSLQDFHDKHPDLVKAGTAMSSMAVADPYLAAIAVSAQLYFGDKKLDQKLVDVPAKVVGLASMLQKVLPVTFAMQSVVALAYIVYANNAPGPVKPTTVKKKS